MVLRRGVAAFCRAVAVLAVLGFLIQLYSIHYGYPHFLAGLCLSPSIVAIYTLIRTQTPGQGKAVCHLFHPRRSTLLFKNRRHHISGPSWIQQTQPFQGLNVPSQTKTATHTSRIRLRHRRRNDPLISLLWISTNVERSFPD
jgi:hypothetical protein